jgi:hypothetical protein
MRTSAMAFLTFIITIKSFLEIYLHRRPRYSAANLLFSCNKTPPAVSAKSFNPCPTSHYWRRPHYTSQPVPNQHVLHKGLSSMESKVLMSCLPQSKSSARLTMERQWLCTWPNDEITEMGIVIVLLILLKLTRRAQAASQSCQVAQALLWSAWARVISARAARAARTVVKPKVISAETKTD